MNRNVCRRHLQKIKDSVLFLFVFIFQSKLYESRLMSIPTQSKIQPRFVDHNLVFVERRMNFILHERLNPVAYLEFDVHRVDLCKNMCF